MPPTYLPRRLKPARLEPATFLCVTLATIAACGGKVRVERASESGSSAGGADDGNGSTGSVGAGTSSGGAGGSAAGAGGAGGGGGSAVQAMACESLQWSGPPLWMSIPTEPSNPALVSVSADKAALTFAEDLGGTLSISSILVTNPFSTWPPGKSALQAHLPTPFPYAVTTGTNGKFGIVAVSSTEPEVAVGNAKPGQKGIVYTGFNASLGPVRFASRLGTGETLMGSGPSSYMSASVVGPDNSFVDFGTVGCATPFAHGAASARPGIGAWFFASAVDAVNDTCLDPDTPGPASFVQVHRADPKGMSQVGSIEVLPAVAELDLVDHGEGAFLGTRAEGSIEYDVRLVDARGVISQDPIATLSNGLVEGSYALAAADGGVFAAELISSTSQPGGELNVHYVGLDGRVTVLQSGGELYFPYGTPGVLASDDGRSLIVAFASAETEPKIGLLRAECIQ